MSAVLAGAGVMVVGVVAGGGVDGTGEADSSVLPQALSASADASDTTKINDWRGIFIEASPAQDLGGIFNI
jgi:hypothetical protein